MLTTLIATSFENDDEALQTYKTAKQIMSEGHFNLRKWRTNSQILLKRINQAENISCDAKTENGANGSAWYIVVNQD